MSQWMIREDKLDPDQKRFINETDTRNSNVWILGFAGSGKSVLLVHSLKKILQNNPSANVAIVVFTQSLVDLFKTGLIELAISNVPVMTYYQFYDNKTRYDYIFCDEVQDLPERILTSMKNRVNKYIIVAGDSNQSIYDIDPRWKESTISREGPGIILNANKYELSIIHRLSQSIITAIQKLIPSMNIWAAKRDLAKVDVNIRLCEAHKYEEEVTYIMQKINEATSVKKSCGVLLPTAKDVIKFADQALKSNGKHVWKQCVNSYGRPDYGDLNRYLQDCGIKIEYVGNGYGSLKHAEDNNFGIIMTYHSSKGLDFDNVFIPFVNNSLFITPEEGKAKTIFMVALSRSRQNLFLTYTGYTSNYVDPFKDLCSKIDIHKSIAGSIGTHTTSISSNEFNY